MKKWVCVCLIILTVFSVALSACSANKVSIPTVTEASSSNVTSTSTPLSMGNEITEWKSKVLASNMVFGPDVAATIGGKDYLVCSVNFGTNPEGSGTNADVGIIIIDISNPESPDEISYLKNGSDEPDQYIENLKLDNSILYAITRNYLWIIDVSDPYHPKDLGKTSFTGAVDIAISGKYAYLTSGNNTISTFDISDLTHHYFAGEITLPSYAGVLKSSGSLLFALSGNGLHIFDISIPSSLKEIGFFPNPFPPLTGVIAPERIDPDFFDMALAGKYLYIVSGIDKLLVVDISNPASPHTITDFETRAQGTDIIISGKLAYMLSSDGSIQFSEHILSLLEIVDISNPGKLIELNSVQLPQTFPDSYDSLIEANNHLYINHDRNPIIEIMDLASTHGG